LLTCQSNRFVDNSSNAFAITVNGSPSVQAFSPFNPTAAWSAATYGGSGYFDGSGDYLDAGAQTAFAFGTGSWTVEAWVYVTTLQEILLFDTRSSASTAGVGCRIASDGTLSYSGSANNALTTSAITANSWNHVAWVYDGTTLSGYINGARGGTATPSFNITQNNGVIGRVGFSASGYMIGYVSSLRVVKGSAVYSGASFTLPTAPLTAITNTSLLLNFTNAGIYDATSKNDLETVGNAQISTTQSKFGGSSMYFDGSGDFLRSPFSQINRINTTGNFTIEFWAYFNSVAADQRLIGWDNNTNNFVIAIYTNTNGNLAYYLSSTGTSWNIAQAVTMGSIAINNWYHVALVRNGSTFTPYINGVAGTTTTSSATLTASTLPLTIGAVGSVASFFNGYINDFRITNGIARYTSNFTPPTAAFPIQ
jgi:hypothetical protein